MLVRLTTDDGTWPDRECILTPLDWSELDHKQCRTMKRLFGRRIEVGRVARLEIL